MIVEIRRHDTYSPSGVYSFADLFSRQVQAYGRPDDVLAVFTASGNSENIFRALASAITQNRP
jgi:phosphoheptose isomerase